MEQELIGIDAYMDELSEQIEPYIDEVVQDYGLKCVKFSLAGLDIDNSKYDEIDQSQIASISKVKLAQGDKGVMDVLGEDWGRQQAANILGDLACEFQARSSMDERTAAITMLKRLDTNDTPYIVIMDRGYDGFNMIENCNRLDNCNYVIRTKCNNVGIKEITSLPDKEIDTEMTFRVTTSGHYFKNHKDEEPDLHLVKHFKHQYKKERSKYTTDRNWDFGVFENISCRVVKFQVSEDEWEVLVTNLNRFEFPLAKMKELYHLRWDIETSFRELKYALGGISFHSKKDDFLEMEILAHLIMFNVVSRNIEQVNVPQVNHKYDYAIDFKMACLITRKYFNMYCNKPYDDLLVEIIGYIVPIRPNRRDKRNMKPKSAVWFVYRVA